MKLKYQHGGTFVPPYAVFQPLVLPDATENTSTTVSSGKKSSSSSTNDVMKEIYDTIQSMGGLPGDIAASANSMVSLINSIEQKLNNPSVGLFGGTSSIAQDYYALMGKIKNNAFYEERFKKAEELAVQKGSYNEVVINSYGQVMVKNEEGEFEWVTPEEYHANSDILLPVTNAYLLDARARGDSGLAHNLESLDVVASSVGMDSITKKINDIIKDLKNESIYSQGYSNIENKRLKEGINVITQAIQSGALSKENYTDGFVMDGIYKNEALTETQKENAGRALSFLMQSLTDSEIALLKMKTNGTASGVQNALAQVASSRAGFKTEFKSDYQKDLNSDGSKKDDKSDKMSAIQLLQVDRAPIENTRINQGTADNLLIRAGIIINEDKSGDPLGLHTLKDYFDKSKAVEISNGNHVTVGNQIVEAAAFPDVLITSNTIAKVWLPLDMEKYNKGVITPDSKYLVKLSDMWKQAREKGISNDPSPQEKQQINEICKILKIEPYYADNGEVNYSFYKPFLTFNGVVTSDAFEQNIDLDFDNFKVVKDLNLAEKYWRMIKGKDAEYDPDDSIILPEFGHDDVYESQIYIPMKQSALYGAMGNGTVSTDIWEKITSAEQSKERAKTARINDNKLEIQ